MGAIVKSKNQIQGQVLTERERAVAARLCAGLSNKQIGAELGISPHTVKFHVANVAMKLDSTTRTEAAVKYALMIERTQQDEMRVALSSVSFA